jgi:hypothetical protein
MPKAKRIEDMSDAELSRLSGKAYDEAMPEPDTTFGKLGRKAAGVAMAPAGALVSGATLGTNPRGPSVIDAAKYGAKSMYHAMTGDKKAAEKADKELKQDVDRAQSVKRQRDSGESTNEMGDKYAKGGSVSSASRRADGIATKGKTKGTMVKMNYGGKC